MEVYFFFDCLLVPIAFARLLFLGVYLMRMVSLRIAAAIAPTPPTAATTLELGSLYQRRNPQRCVRKRVKSSSPTGLHNKRVKCLGLADQCPSCCSAPDSHQRVLLEVERVTSTTKQEQLRRLSDTAERIFIQ
jgi:hypothetical protein